MCKRFVLLLLLLVIIFSVTCDSEKAVDPLIYDSKWRGDINLNGIPFEIADAVVFTNYFRYGLGAFDINPENQIASTEINCDGTTGSVADLVYLIRVIVGDALPLTKLKPAGNIQVVGGDAITINAKVGAAAFVFEGNADVTLGSGASGMELYSNFDGSNTNVLVYTFEHGLTATGEILISNSTLVSADVSDYNGNAYTARIVPFAFALYQNYPNPFNLKTTIHLSMGAASEWNISIFNVASRKVADFGGYSEAGTVTVKWNASDMSTGVYYYTATVGDFSETKKMMLIK